MPSTALILVFALAAVSEAGAPTRNVQFPGGHTSVDSEGDVDHVVVHDAQGNVTAESRCDSGRFSDYFVLFTRFKDAIGGGDRDAALTG